jgi:PAS domain-containing protein
MKDEERSKEQLLDELISLRLQLASLKASRAEQRQVEQAVCFGGTHRGLSLDDIPLAAWIHDESWRFLMVNQAAIERYGYSREEFLSMTLGDIRPREDMVELENFLKTASQKRRLTAR